MSLEAVCASLKDLIRLSRALKGHERPLRAFSPSMWIERSASKFGQEETPKRVSGGGRWERAKKESNSE